MFTIQILMLSVMETVCELLFCFSGFLEGTTYVEF